MARRRIDMPRRGTVAGIDAKALVDTPADPRAIDAWAAVACVSERTLGRRFVEETGFGFTARRQRARLMRALEMLADGEAVTTIALDLGYATASGFIALFRRTFGEPPASYRAGLVGADHTRGARRVVA